MGYDFTVRDGVRVKEEGEYPWPCGRDLPPGCHPTDCRAQGAGGRGPGMTFYVRLGKLWHLMRSNGRTYCGRDLPPDCHPTDDPDKKAVRRDGLCKRCKSAADKAQKQG